MATGESINYQINGINNQITDEFGADNDLEVTGGGRGWTARTTVSGVVYSARDTSKLGAANALYNALKDADDAVTMADAEMGDPDAIEALDGEAEFEKCSIFCQSSLSDFCQCSCGGDNHGTLLGLGRRPATTLADKPCLCGCGETTKRRYVPGHDARHHFALRAASAGQTVEGFRASLKAAANAKAAAKRRAARAERRSLASER